MERVIPDPGFPGDTGAADGALAAVLARYERGDAEDADVLAALVGARVLVPVVAVAGVSTGSTTEPGGEARADPEKDSHMAAVLLTGADGRMALLAFTGTDALATWDPEARPVPVTARTAAQSAVQEGAAALVLDVAGPVRYVVEGDDLVAMAAGWTLTRVGDHTVWLR